MTLTLKEFIQKNKTIANQEARCGGCGNALQQCGRYRISKTENEHGIFESILCETCVNNLRVPKRATKIDSNGNILNYQIPGPFLTVPNKEQLSFREQAKINPRPEIVEFTKEQIEKRELAKINKIAKESKEKERKQKFLSDIEKDIDNEIKQIQQKQQETKEQK